MKVASQQNAMKIAGLMRMQLMSCPSSEIESLIDQVRRNYVLILEKSYSFPFAKALETSKSIPSEDLLMLLSKAKKFVRI